MKLVIRTFTVITGALFTALALVGCLPQPPAEGIVINKSYVAAHDESYRVSISTYEYGCHFIYDYDLDGNYGSTYVCEYFFGNHGKTEERVRHVPDRWSILFEGMNSENKLKQHIVNVSQAQYDQAQPGYFIKIVDNAAFISAR